MYRAEKYEGALTPALEGGTDLVPAQYEGGLKIWECSEDLVRYQHTSLLRVSHLIRLQI
jgi:hypothetical protein